MIQSTNIEEDSKKAIDFFNQLSNYWIDNNMNRQLIQEDSQLLSNAIRELGFINVLVTGTKESKHIEFTIGFNKSIV